ncbi:MAG: hypothetical protein RL174_23 [Actinomycetota bacterium]|jgi:hypothetical protein
MTVENSQTSAGQVKPKFYPLVPVVLKPETETQPQAQPQTQPASQPLADLRLGAEKGQESDSLIEPAPIFEVSPNLIDPTSASIYVESVPDANNMSHVLETGEILTTGAIDISKILADTGEITALEPNVDDESDANDSQQINSSAFAPMRATSVSNFGAELSIVPPKLNRGEGQLYVALTVSISLVAIGSLVLAGYMLDFFK